MPLTPISYLQHFQSNYFPSLFSDDDKTDDSDTTDGSEDYLNDVVTRKEGLFRLQNSFFYRSYQFVPISLCNPNSVH